MRTRRNNNIIKDISGITFLLAFALIAGCQNRTDKVSLSNDSTVTDAVSITHKGKIISVHKDSLKKMFDILEYTAFVDTNNFIIIKKEDTAKAEAKLRPLMKEPFSEVSYDRNKPFNKKNVQEFYDILAKYYVVEKKGYFLISKKEMESLK